MDIILYIILFLLLIAIIFAIPFALGFCIYKISKRKLSTTYSVILASIIPLIFIYFIYIAFYPNDDFYEEEFKEITEMEFPQSGEILKKDASYPVIGDYCSSALIQFNKDDFNMLFKKINQNERFIDTPIIYSEQYSYVMDDIDEARIIYKAFNSYKYEKSHDYHYIAFLNDNRTVVIHLINE